MRLSVPLLTVLGTVAGTIAAVAAYQSGAEAGGAPVPQSDTTATVRPAPTQAARTTWLPCEKGTKLRRGVCVRIRHKVVVVTDPAPALPAYAPVVSAAQPAPARPARSRSHPRPHDGPAKGPLAPPAGEGGHDETVPASGPVTPDPVQPPEPGDD